MVRIAGKAKQPKCGRPKGSFTGQMMPDSCKFNNGVRCSGFGCKTCGWNPEEEERRRQVRNGIV